MSPTDLALLPTPTWNPSRSFLIRQPLVQAAAPRSKEFLKLKGWYWEAVRYLVMGSATPSVCSELHTPAGFVCCFLVLAEHCLLPATCPKTSGRSPCSPPFPSLSSTRILSFPPPTCQSLCQQPWMTPGTATSFVLLHFLDHKLASNIQLFLFHLRAFKMQTVGPHCSITRLSPLPNFPGSSTIPLAF